MVVPACTQTAAPSSFERTVDAQRLLGHEALAVIVVDGREIEAERAVARACPGRVAREHVDLARLQRREALLGVERRVLDLGRVTQEGRSHRPAQVDVEARPVVVRDRPRRTRAGPRRSTPHWTKPFALTASTVAPARASCTATSPVVAMPARSRAEMRMCQSSCRYRSACPLMLPTRLALPGALQLSRDCDTAVRDCQSPKPRVGC